MTYDLLIFPKLLNSSIRELPPFPSLKRAWQKNGRQKNNTKPKLFLYFCLNSLNIEHWALLIEYSSPLPANLAKRDEHLTARSAPYRSPAHQGANEHLTWSSVLPVLKEQISLPGSRSEQLFGFLSSLFVQSGDGLEHTEKPFCRSF